jgi:hypothetical protein
MGDQFFWLCSLPCGSVETALPPCPANLVRDRGALKCELDRAREIALSVGLLREVSEYLGLAARQAELPKCTE